VEERNTERQKEKKLEQVKRERRKGEEKTKEYNSLVLPRFLYYLSFGKEQKSGRKK
jgi:hypothetical protein